MTNTSSNPHTEDIEYLPSSLFDHFSIINAYLSLQSSTIFPNPYNVGRTLYTPTYHDQNHRFFENFDWKNFVYLSMPAPYIPEIKSEDDTSNFEKYPESDTESPSVDKKNDPFLKW